MRMTQGLHEQYLPCYLSRKYYKCSFQKAIRMTPVSTGKPTIIRTRGLTISGTVSPKSIGFNLDRDKFADRQFLS